MILALHQPHYFPWLGYLDRMQRADIFVVLDHVQFERRYYQNRAQILVDGRPHWLTVPVVQHSQKERIIDKEIDNPPPEEARWWGANHYQTLKHAYRNAPFFELYAPLLQKILATRPDKLVDIDQLSLEFLREAMDIQTPLLNSSALNIQGNRSEMILEICELLGADTYLAGMGGSRNYLDRQIFADAGIKIVWQEYVHPVYTQRGSGPFVPGLAAIDLLFNHGPNSQEILRGLPRTEDLLALA